MSFYLYASAILLLFIQESSSVAVQRFLHAADWEMAVSEFAAAEVASGLSRPVRMGGLDRATAAGHLADFDIWRGAFKIEPDIQASDIRLANIFVRRFDLGLRTPDAPHAAVCRRCDFQLVTLDRRLAEAAEALGAREDKPS